MTRNPSRHQIWKMFDEIAPTYDKVNRVITLGLDIYWRAAMRRYLPPAPSLTLLDCATGTGDQILSLLKRAPHLFRITGIDLAEEMLSLGREKIAKARHADRVDLRVGSLLAIPCADSSFDCVTISFGIRNVTDVELALKECHRVLKPGGRLLILEGTIPKSRLLQKIHLFYLRHCLPRFGKWISHHATAYRYLNETIETFPHGPAFVALLRQAGFNTAGAHPLTGGIATIYQGDK